MFSFDWYLFDILPDIIFFVVLIIIYFVRITKIREKKRRG